MMPSLEAVFLKSANTRNNLSTGHVHQGQSAAVADLHASLVNAHLFKVSPGTVHAAVMVTHDHECQIFRYPANKLA